MTEPTFPPPSSDKSVLENGTVFTPRFDANGLITAVVTDITDGRVLMVAHMNAEALALTLETGIAHYWSRSRQVLWKKGETSGNLQHVKQLRTDCDQDALVVEVAVAGDGVSCHTGKHSCFYRIITNADGTIVLKAE